MSSMSSHRSATGVLLLITLIRLSQVWSQDATCPDELNPFNITSFSVPYEADNEPKVELALYWIPRKDLGCAANHNDDLKKKVSFTGRSSLFISLSCREHVNSWLGRIIKVVQHNLMVTLKVKTINFFQPFEDFKNLEFKGQHITSLPSDQILQILEKTEQDIKNGLTLSGNDMLPARESFNETFYEILRVNDGLYHAMFDVRKGVLDPFNSCNKDDKQCPEQLYKTLIGESTDFFRKGLGYTKIRKFVEDGIHIVRAAFRKGTSERDHFDGLKLPMTPPCFST